MTFLAILILALGLAMDAMAVSFAFSVGNKMSKAAILKLAAIFGLFHLLMPVVGYSVGIGIKNYIEGFDHWLAFGLLSIVGIKMLLEYKNDSEEHLPNNKILLLALATSVDVFIVGITFNFIKINIPLSIVIIGIMAFVLPLASGLFAKNFSHFEPKYLKIFGGLAIFAIGAKILLEHLF